MKLGIYTLQILFTLLLIIGLVFIFPIYLYAKSELVIVEIKQFKFVPQQVLIKPGTTVRWINKEKRQYHSVWFKSLTEIEPDYLFPDESYQRKFDTEGSFPYRCGPHPEMQGAVNVKF